MLRLLERLPPGRARQVGSPRSRAGGSAAPAPLSRPGGCFPSGRGLRVAAAVRRTGSVGAAGAGGSPPGAAGRGPVTPLGAEEAEVPLSGTSEGGRARPPPGCRAVLLPSPASRGCGPRRPPSPASPKRNGKYRLRAGRGCTQRVLLPSLRCWNIGSAAPGEAPWPAWVCLTAVLEEELLQQAKKAGAQKSLGARGQWETGGIHRPRLGDQHLELCVAS